MAQIPILKSLGLPHRSPNRFSPPTTGSLHPPLHPPLHLHLFTALVADVAHNTTTTGTVTKSSVSLVLAGSSSLWLDFDFATASKMITFCESLPAYFSRPFFNTNFTVNKLTVKTVTLASCLMPLGCTASAAHVFFSNELGSIFFFSRPAPQRAASLALQSDNFNFFNFFYFSSWVHFFGESASPKCFFIIRLDTHNRHVRIFSAAPLARLGSFHSTLGGKVTRSPGQGALACLHWVAHSRPNNTL